MVYRKIHDKCFMFKTKTGQEEQIMALEELQERTIHHHCLAPVNIIHQITQMGLVDVLNMALHNKITSHLVQTLSTLTPHNSTKCTVSILPSNPSKAQYQRSKQMKPFDTTPKETLQNQNFLHLNCVIPYHITLNN